MFKKLICLILLFAASFNVISQESERNTTNVARLNIINPGFEYEMPVLNQSTLLFGVNWLYESLPNLDIEYRNYYNLDRRVRKEKNIDFNSGDFWGVRVILREDINYLFYRRLFYGINRDYDILIAPMWGVQRSYKQFGFLFDVNPALCVDIGNDTEFIILLELKLSYNLSK